MSPALLNIEFTDMGAASMSKGYSTFCSSLGTAGVDGLHVFAVGGVDTLVSVQSALTRYATAAASTWAVATGSTGLFTAGVDVCMRTVENEVYATNGYTTPHRYDGTEMFTVGVSAYTGGLTGTVAVSTGAGSMLAGSYYYGIAAENSNGVESNVATFTTLMTTIAGDAIAISGLPFGYPSSADVSTRYLYRTTAGSTTEFYRVTALTAAQTAYTDTHSDSDLVTAAETDNYPPPKGAFWWYHRGRMFMAGDPSYPYRVYYSQASEPEIWPALNYVTIGDGDGQPITAIAVMGNSLVVHKSNAAGTSKSIWLIYMPDSTEVTDVSNWYIVKSPSAYAALGWKSIAFFQNMMAFIDRTGMYAFTGDDIAQGPATSQIGQYAADSLSANIEGDFKAQTAAALKAAPMVDYDNTLWLGMYNSPAGLYSYDYETASNQRGIGAWSKHILASSCDQAVVFNSALYVGAAANGKVYKMWGEYSTESADALTYYYTPDIAGHKQHWEMAKVWRNIYLTISHVAGCNTIVCAYVDGVSPSYTIDGTTARTNAVVRIPILTTDGNPLVSKSVQLYFSAAGKSTFAVASTAWQIHRVEVEYLLRSRRT